MLSCYLRSNYGKENNSHRDIHRDDNNYLYMFVIFLVLSVYGMYIGSLRSSAYLRLPLVYGGFIGSIVSILNLLSYAIN